ncbi:MAG: FKBP-type peptidyl-prolyl cis-trans isomerase, partial [Candidatus Heimdallarchaeota archaeon]|nr:FKBP-type peptidyl-prolyl cis-trans isomerase [Candidatus Heimdallarchaeota archaeon]MCK4876194.1 FKBP-type peptidyl-prolyl cis-trans isomerase [Candidatus Heimdallarchaeota archaeon]
MNSSAALPVVKENDLISIGYRLTVSAALVEVYTKQSPFKGQVAIDIIRPIGLYNEVIGMKLGEVRNLIVAPEDGFSEYDPEYGAYAGLTLYYDDLTIFEVNGVHITDVENGGLTPGSFGFYFLRVVLGLLGV